MKTHDISILFVFLLLTAGSKQATAQNKKEVKLNRIKSVSEYVTIPQKTGEITYRETYTVYNKKGMVIEESTFNPDSTLKRKIVTHYNFNEDMSEEIIYTPLKQHKVKEHDKDAAPVVLIKEQTGAVAEKEEGETETVQYTTNSDGKKGAELHLDADHKQKKKSLYSYNSKGLRIKKENYDAQNRLVSLITYKYEYY